MVRFIIISVIPLSTVIPLVLGLIRYNRLDRVMRFLVFYLVYDVAFTATSIIYTMHAGHHGNNIWLLNIFFPIQSGLLIWMFSMWEPNARLRRIFRVMIAVMVLLWLGEGVARGLDEFSEIAKPFGCLLIIAGAANAIYRGNQSHETTLLFQPGFWVSAAYLINFSGLFLLTLFSSVMIRQSVTLLMIIFNVILPSMTLMETTLLSRGMLCQPRSQT